MPRSLRTTVLLAVAASLVVSGCSGDTSTPAPTPAEPADSGPELDLDLDRLPARLEDGVELVVGGSAQLRATLRTEPGGGAIDAVAGRRGGQALRLPAYVAGAREAGRGGQPLAAVEVVPFSLAPPHPLAPGSQPFSFGASFRLDEAAGGSGIDAGNNLMQRGSFADEAQYKLQVDEREPSCRVVGDEGALLAKADFKVLADTWYDVLCARSEQGLELTVTEHPDDGPARTSTFTARGPTGDLSALDPAVPLSVGGKLTPTGLLVRSDTDQFNGVVDDVVLSIEG